jgi:hypothetical protein
VNVTDWPNIEGEPDVVTAVAVAGGAMVREACAELLPKVAVITAVVVVVTDVVVTVKDTVVAPAATVTLPGTLAEELLLVKLTTVPPDGAVPLKVTLPWDGLPPWTPEGLSVSEEMVTVDDPGVIVIEAWTVLFPRDAVITTEVLLRTPDLVVTVNVALELPAGTVTLAGTSANELLLLNPTTVPPDGAAALRVTVPWDVPPSWTVVGFNVSEESVRPLHVPPPVFGVSLKTVP